MLHRRILRTVTCKGPDPVLLGAVEIGILRIAGLDRGGDKAVMQFVPCPQIGNAERAARAVMPVRAALLVFGAAEIRKHVLIRPAGIAELAPQIEILALAADINQPVDRARPAEDLAARPHHAPSAQFGERLGLELPGKAGVVDVAVKAGRDMDPRVLVLAAGFEQQDARARIVAQPVGQHTPGRPGPDNDVIELRFLRHDPDRAML